MKHLRINIYLVILLMISSPQVQKQGRHPAAFGKCFIALNSLFVSGKGKLKIALGKNYQNFIISEVKQNKALRLRGVSLSNAMISELAHSTPLTKQGYGLEEIDLSFNSALTPRGAIKLLRKLKSQGKLEGLSSFKMNYLSDIANSQKTGFNQSGLLKYLITEFPDLQVIGLSNLRSRDLKKFVQFKNLKTLKLAHGAIEFKHLKVFGKFNFRPSKLQTIEVSTEETRGNLRQFNNYLDLEDSLVNNHQRIEEQRKTYAAKLRSKIKKTSSQKKKDQLKAQIALYTGRLSKLKLKPIENFHRVRIIDGYDGDTITVQVINVGVSSGKKVTVRITGINSAEMSDSHKYAKKLASAANNYRQFLQDNRKVTSLVDQNNGLYGRTQAESIMRVPRRGGWISRLFLPADTINIGEKLRVNGLVMEYHGEYSVSDISPAQWKRMYEANSNFIDRWATK